MDAESKLRKLGRDNCAKFDGAPSGLMKSGSSDRAVSIEKVRRIRIMERWFGRIEGFEKNLTFNHGKMSLK